MEGVKVKYHAAGEGVGPVLASFLQGPPPEHSLTGDGDDGRGQFERLAFQYAADSARPAKRQLSASNSSVSYEGRNHGDGVVQRAGDVRYLLGVYSKKRGRLDVYEPDAGGVVFGLRLKAVRGSGADAAAASRASGSELALDDRARRDILISAFGSRKKQAMDASQKANIINPNAVAAAAGVAKTIAKSAAAAAAAASSSSAAAGGVVPGVVAVETSAAAAAAAAVAASSSGAAAGVLGSTSTAKIETALMEARMAKLPPFRLDATAPADAYPLPGLLPPHVADALYGSVAAVLRVVAASVNGDASASSSSSAAAGEEGGNDNDVEDLVFRLTRGSLAARALLTAITERAAAMLSANASGGGSKKGKKGGSSKKRARTESEGGGDDDDGADASEEPGAQFTPAQKRALSGRIGCALYFKHLVSLFTARDRLAFKPERPRDDKKDGDGDDAAAAAVDVDAAAAAPKLVIPGLKFVPAGVLEHLLATFTEERKGGGSGDVDGTADPRAALTYVRTPDLTDRLACHIACAALHAHGLPGVCGGSGSLGVPSAPLDLGDLARDLKMAPIRLAAVFRELGCRAEPVRASGAVAPAAGGDEDDDEEAAAAAAAGGSSTGPAKGAIVSYRVSLWVPLTFPKPKMGRKK